MPTAFEPLQGADTAPDKPALQVSAGTFRDTLEHLPPEAVAVIAEAEDTDPQGWPSDHDGDESPSAAPPPQLASSGLPQTLSINSPLYDPPVSARAPETPAQLRIEYEDVAVAAVVAIPFALYALVAAIGASPTAANWSAADPILKILPQPISLWLVPLAAFAAAAGWWYAYRPYGDDMRRGAKYAGLGALAAVLIAGLMRAAVGPELPAFIPSEESAGPGFALGMAAGLGEEVLFHLALMPALYFGMRRRFDELPSIGASIFLTSLAFMIAHEIGVWSFDAGHMLTRFMVPGVLMGAAWFLHPAFIVAAHATAHIMIPLLFVA